MYESSTILHLVVKVMMAWTYYMIKNDVSTQERCANGNSVLAHRKYKME